MRRKIGITPWAGLVLCASLLLGVTACGDDSGSSAGTTSGGGAATTGGGGAATTGGSGGEAMKIGFITKFPVDFYDTMVQGAKDWNKDHPEVTLIFAQGASGTDDEGEINAIQSMVTQGVKAIAITPTSPNVQDELQKAVDAGIVVVLVDNDIPDWDGKVSVVATDNLAGGKLAGEFMKGQVPAGAQIGILQGVPGAPSLDDRVTGFLDGLGDGYNIVSKLPTDCDQTKGLNAAQDMLTANPDIAAIYGACGPPIIGALEAIKTAGKTLVTVGFDAGPDEITAILAGTETASVAQFPAKMGELGADTAFRAANGEDVPANVDTGTAIVTKENAADFQ